MDNHTTQAIVLEGRYPANGRLLAWLEARFAHIYRAQHPFGSGQPDYLAPWRNLLVRWFLEETVRREMLMIDADMVPLPETEELLRTAADVAGCRCIGKSGFEVHGEDGVISHAFMRVTRKALEAIAPPWFAYEMSPDGSCVAKCTCRYFSEKAVAAGFPPVHVGEVGHLIPMVARLPSQPGKICQVLPPQRFMEVETETATPPHSPRPQGYRLDRTLGLG